MSSTKVITSALSFGNLYPTTNELVLGFVGNVFLDNKIILFSIACLIAFTDIFISSPGDLISIGILFSSSIIIASYLS